MAIYSKCSQCGKKILQGQQCECRKDRYKEYNKRVRFNKDNKKYFDFYNTIHWKRMSKYIKNKYNEVCLKCLLKYKILTPSDVAHHIVPIREDYSKRLEEKNLIPLCHGCHNRIDHINYTEEMKDELRSILEEYKKIYI